MTRRSQEASRYPINCTRMLFYILLITILPMFDGLLTNAVAGDGRCTKSEYIRPTINCDYRRQQVKTVTGLKIPHDCRTLDISYNLLTSINDSTFVDLTDLLSLNLSNNQITRLEPKAFLGLANLICFHLEYNPLSYSAYPVPVFIPLVSLKVLNIGQGKDPIIPEVTYPDVALSSLGSLEELHMDMLKDVQFRSGFAKLRRLQILSDGRLCKIEELFNETFTVFENSTVTTLTLSSCRILGIESNTFVHFRNLKNLSISNNFFGLSAALRSLAGLAGRNMTSIDISRVNTYDAPLSDVCLTKNMFEYLKDICVQSLDLSDNTLVYFDASALLTFRQPECLKEFRFTKFYLKRSSLSAMYLYLNRFPNLRHIEVTHWLRRPVSVDSHKRLKTTTAVNAGNSKVLSFHIPPRLELMDISYVSMTCRGFSDICLLGGSRLHTLDMSHDRGQLCFRMRWHGFEHVQVLYISGNDYSSDLSYIFLDSFPNLTTLVARDTNLVIPFQTDTADLLFRSLVLLRHLDLANSGISNIPYGLLTHQTELITLDLGYNKFSELPTIIYSLHNLLNLDMRFNALRTIPSRDRQLLDSVVERRGKFLLFLDGNPFTCNCGTFDFLEWIWTSDVQFDNYGNYSCVLNNGSVVSMPSLRSKLNVLKIQCVSSFWIVFAALGASVLIVCLVGTAVGYRYRVPITYWCITLCKKPEAEPEKRHRYDALIAYCHEDYEWVCHTFRPKLEKKEIQFGYKLCIYDRDFNFIPGLTIEENVVNAINSSFKTILVITPAFVRSAWCRFEIQMARMKMINEGRQDVIIPVILQDVPVSAMPKALLNLWNTSVFLVWSERLAEQRHFWNKLTSALGPARVEKLQDVVADDLDEQSERELEDVLDRDEQRPLLSQL